MYISMAELTTVLKTHKVYSMHICHIVPLTFCEPNNLGASANLASRVFLYMLVYNENKN